ncbi:hypothetical protein IGI04_012212 [Brassica rapa subsp. trilocularis]|uniref:DUF506 domain-containing protein n=1 Tax=Brassica rapa subsp. trilocularis TaxID=1813537 RepID=A0ABQ7N630_BRACM|nr:hypothetical protein IGI04_012212 [Brassica rapa subsp. trilocularis]
MPFTMKIQPIDIDSPSVAKPEAAGKPVLKSRLKRLFDRPFRNATSEKPFPGGEAQSATEFEPSSVCLTKMVQNFIEENNEKQAKCGRNRCNCFNGSNNDSSDDDESDLFASDHLKSLIPCATVAESNLLADVAKIVDKNNKSVKRKEEMRKMVNEGLLSLRYDSSICKSKWDKSPSFPAGEYEYIDVIVGEERLLIEVDFRSEFDIARQTSGYKALLQSLPFVFVGKSDRLSQIVALISEAAKVSMKKRGMHLPPWRKAEYMRSKWMSSYTRASGNAEELPLAAAAAEMEVDCEEIELVFEEKSLSPVVVKASSSVDGDGADAAVKAVTGLALLFKEKP